jgi:hypothetical protein
MRAARSVANRLGVDIVRKSRGTAPLYDPDLDSAAIAIIERALPYTMTSVSRLFSVIEAVRYIAHAGIEGDIVECGVWRGGSMIAAALTLLECGLRSRELHLFDTYEGMSPPTENDVDFHGRDAGKLLTLADREEQASIWCNAPIDQVRAALSSTGYDPSRMHFIEGKVEDTLPGRAPRTIALLRLDTDWYESTRHELEHLYPRLTRGGVLIIDDYGHWAGCRKAVDEYVKRNDLKLLLNRVDYTGRIAVKIE